MKAFLGSLLSLCVCLGVVTALNVGQQTTFRLDNGWGGYGPRNSVDQGIYYGNGLNRYGGGGYRNNYVDRSYGYDRYDDFPNDRWGYYNNGRYQPRRREDLLRNVNTVGQGTTITLANPGYGRSGYGGGYHNNYDRYDSNRWREDNNRLASFWLANPVDRINRGGYNNGYYNNGYNQLNSGGYNRNVNTIGNQGSIIRSGYGNYGSNYYGPGSNQYWGSNSYDGGTFRGETYNLYRGGNYYGNGWGNQWGGNGWGNGYDSYNNYRGGNYYGNGWGNDYRGGPYRNGYNSGYYNNGYNNGYYNNGYNNGYNRGGFWGPDRGGNAHLLY